jgi:hypothetical protein
MMAHAQSARIRQQLDAAKENKVHICPIASEFLMNAKRLTDMTLRFAFRRMSQIRIELYLASDAGASMCDRKNECGQ